MTFFLGTPTLGIQNFWMFIFSSNQACLEHARAISYIPQKDLSNNVLHPLIENHLTIALRGFVVKSQIPNLILDLFFIITYAY
jgi:hypothetical protein